MNRTRIALTVALLGLSTSLPLQAAQPGPTERAQFMLTAQPFDATPLRDSTATPVESAEVRARRYMSGQHQVPADSARGDGATINLFAADDRARAMMAGQTTQAPQTSVRHEAPTGRQQVSAEVQKEMRNGNWRCETNNRGWCGVIGL